MKSPCPRYGHSQFRSFTTAAIVFTALAVRIIRAVTEPTVNPDVIRFINLGKALFGGRQIYRDEPYHPLHAIMARLFHDLFTVHLIADDRFAWVAATKAIGILAGTVITWLIIRTSRHLGAPWWAAAGAGLLWAVGRRTSAYGADGMSDMPFLAFFGGALLLAMHHRFRPGWHWLAIGLLAGFSYLARPEGVAVLLILALTLGIMSLRHRLRRSLSALTKPRFAPVRSAALMAAGFLLPAAPYMLVIGRFTGKKDLVVPFTAIPVHVLPLAQIHLDTLISWDTWRRLAMELWETFGFAACIIVGLAMLLKPRLWGRVHWRPLVVTWILLWLGVMLWLLDKTRTRASPEGYLDGRHTLVLLFMLHCLFGLALDVWRLPMVWWQDYWRRKPVWPHLPAWRRSPRWSYIFSGGVLLLACLPGIIMLKEPPGGNRQYIRDGADWLSSHTTTDTVIAFREGTLAFYSQRGDRLWAGKNTDGDVAALRTADPDKERLIVACIFQRERGEIPPEHLGGCIKVASFPAPGSLHHDVLVIYLPEGSHALNK